MKFGQILAARSTDKHRCFIQYNQLKGSLKGSLETKRKNEDFHQRLADSIKDVDDYFQRLQGSEPAEVDQADQMSAAELRTFAVLNYLAVIKILEKHDKRVQRCKRSQAAVKQSAEDFSRISRQLLFKTHFCTAISDSTFFIAQATGQAAGSAQEEDGAVKNLQQPVGRGRADSSSCACPICFEPVLEDTARLPCQHSFCWTCIANCAAQGISNCPLCRQQQSLEPASLEIANILGVPAPRYYPENQLDIQRTGSPMSICTNFSLCTDDASKSPSSSPSPDAKTQISDTPPGTPKTPPRSRKPFPDSPRPPPAPHMAPMPPLMKVLCRAAGSQVNSTEMEALRSALESDPESAQFPFFDHDVEPPLCCAIRLDCSKDVVELLIQYDADVNAEDCCGQTPLALLCKQYSRVENTPWNRLFSDAHAAHHHEQQRRRLELAEVLLQAGAADEPMGSFGLQWQQKTSCVEYLGNTVGITA
jgi:hypothetical protein